MKSVLVIYFSRGGHTAKIAQTMATQINELGGHCDVVNIKDNPTIDWQKYDLVMLGACVLYGSYDKSVFAFVERYQQQLAAIPNCFFSVNVVARKPEKRVLENNKYLQKFIQLSPWQPQHLKIIAGKVDYPSWPWYDRLAIQLIMKMTDGPTDPKSVIDYTDWDDVKAYAKEMYQLVAV